MRRSRFRFLPLVALLLAGRADAEPRPPGGLMDRLAAEAYPERIEAERELADWAVAEGQAAMVWMAGQLDTLKDPEVRQRVFSALRKAVMDDLARKRPGFVGVQMASARVVDGDRVLQGVEILETVENSPASRAGLKVDDVLLDLEGESWKAPDPHHEFARRVGRLGPGAKVRFSVWRKGTIHQVELELAPRPWSAGEYREEAGRLLREGPTYLNEDQAREAIFRQWFEEHRDRPNPGR